MSVLRQDITNFIYTIKLSLINAENIAEVLANISIYGYTKAKLAEGQALLQEAEELCAAQDMAYSKQYSATANLNKAKQLMNELYSTHRKLARLALKNAPAQLTALGISKPKQQTFSGWVGQLTLFYNTALNDLEIKTALARFNLSSNQLEEALAQLQTVVDLNSEQKRCKKAAQQTTKTRNQALDALDVWFTEFKEVAKIALGSDNQLLEPLQFGPIP